MTLTPDDLPPGDDGSLSQVICECGSENFHFVLSGTDVKAVCAGCKSVNGTWPGGLGATGAATPTEAAWRQAERDMLGGGHHGVAGTTPGGPGGGGISHGAAWGPGGGEGGAELLPQPEPIRVTRDDLLSEYRAAHPQACTCAASHTDPRCPQHGTEAAGSVDEQGRMPLLPPQLPNYSSGMCNTYLDGGFYDGQITWLMAGSGEFRVRGMPGVYRPTAAVRDGRIVYRYEQEG